MPFLRQLHNQKPQAWGPVSQVQSSIFKNAERIGIDPSSIALAMPMWGPGDQLDYAKNVKGTNTSVGYSNNSLQFGSSVSRVSIPGTSFPYLSGCIVFGLIPNWFSYGGTNNTLLDSNTSRNLLTHNQSNGLLFYNDGRYVFYSYANAPIDAYKYHTIVTEYNKTGTVQRLWLNGKECTSSAPTGTWGDNTIGTSMYIGDRFEGTNESANAAFTHFFVFSVAPSTSKIAYLSDNPYYLLQRIAPVFYSLPGGGETPTFKPYWAQNATRIAI